MRFWPVCAAIALPLMALASQTGVRGSEFITYQTIADTNTATPDGPGTFLEFPPFRNAVLDQGNVAFLGYGSSDAPTIDHAGIYRYVDGLLQTIADTNTSIPGGVGTFVPPRPAGSWGSPSISGRNVVFTADGENQRGVYKRLDGEPLVRVADRNTRPPGSSDTLSTLSSHAIDGENVALWGFVPSFSLPSEVLLLETDGVLATAVSETTFIPNTTFQRFEGLSYADLMATESRFDLNSDESIGQADYVSLVRDIIGTWSGDANLDLLFDSGDLVDVFQAGEYEDETRGNSTWAEGDWDGNGDFDSGDLVLAFQEGGYDSGRRSKPVPEPTTVLWMILSGAAAWQRFRRRHQRGIK